MTINTLTTIQEGSVVTLAYTLRLQGGTASTLPGAPSPVTFVVGDGQMPKGVEAALLGLSEGAQLDLTLSAEDAFGSVQPNQVINMSRSRFPADRTFDVGHRLRLRRKDGTIRHGYIVAINDDTLKIDFNHPLAGKVLAFHLNVMKIGTE